MLSNKVAEELVILVGLEIMANNEIQDIVLKKFMEFSCKKCILESPHINKSVEVGYTYC